MPLSSNSISCIIIDDEPLQHKVLADYIERMPPLRFDGAFTNPVEAIRFVREHPAGIIFLDIQMPELNGFQVMDILGPGMKVIITSAYKDFALAGFDYDVEDYLLKPVSFERFCKAVSRVLNTRQAMQDNQVQEGFLFVKSGFRLVKVNLGELLYIEALKDYISLVSGKDKVLCLQSLNVMEKKLDAARFIRIHKSYIVALDKISHIEKSSVWIGEKELPLGNTYKDAFLERLKKLQ